MKTEIRMLADALEPTSPIRRKRFWAVVVLVALLVYWLWLR